MKKLLAVLAILFITVTISFAQTNPFDVLRTSYEIPPVSNRLAIVNPLFDQISGQPGSQAITSMHFDNAGSTWTDLHNMAADDFTVPANVSWNVETVELNAAYFNSVFPASVDPDGSGFNVWFYSDNNGQVGSLAAQFLNQSFTQNISGSPSWSGSFLIALDSVLSLPSGTYWMSAQIIKNPCDSPGDCFDFPAVGEYNGQWGWLEAGTNVPMMNESYWQNPPAGWVTGNACQLDVCDTWGARVTQCGIGVNYSDWLTCTGASDPPRDLQFAIGGTVEAVVPPVPVMNQWALMGFAVLLAGAGVFFLRKKA